MVIINSKEIAPRITNSTLFRYASSKGIGVSKILTLLEDITPADLVGVFVYAAKVDGIEVTDDEIWNEFDKRSEVFQEIANHFSEQLTPNLPDEMAKKKK